jgi:hypothetical protein
MLSSSSRIAEYQMNWKGRVADWLGNLDPRSRTSGEPDSQ